jgi:hypothetical protein
VICQWAGGFQHHHLAGAGVAADPQLTVQSRLAGKPVDGHHHDDAAGVLAAGADRRLDRFLQNRLGVGCHDQGHHPSQGDGATLLAQRDDALVDLVGRGLGKIDNHG